MGNHGFPLESRGFSPNLPRGEKGQISGPPYVSSESHKFGVPLLWCSHCTHRCRPVRVSSPTWNRGKTCCSDALGAMSGLVSGQKTLCFHRSQDRTIFPLPEVGGIRNEPFPCPKCVTTHPSTDSQRHPKGRFSDPVPRPRLYIQTPLLP